MFGGHHEEVLKPRSGCRSSGLQPALGIEVAASFRASGTSNDGARRGDRRVFGGPCPWGSTPQRSTVGWLIVNRTTHPGDGASVDWGGVCLISPPGPCRSGACRQRPE